MLQLLIGKIVMQNWLLSTNHILPIFSIPILLVGYAVVSASKGFHSSPCCCSTTVWLLHAWTQRKR